MTTQHLHALIIFVPYQGASCGTPVERCLFNAMTPVPESHFTNLLN